MPRHDVQCCCGRLDCALLVQNCSILESVEKDVHTAAELGQALLARHETYMADAEKERRELVGRVSRLEAAKRDLELENARTIEENRALLDQLELLNSAAADSETHIRSLEATLRSSQQAVRRLETAASRAADMERHIAALEHEQAQLQSQLDESQSESRSTVQRWKKAERGIVELQAQLERMEKEAREESDRHAEVMDWMRRRRAIEKGIGGADELGVRGPAKQTTVVSHFVRDLLQDNANLQMGIAELREMLSSSNDEIQSLREQLLYHQPMAASSVNGDDTADAGVGVDTGVRSHASTLRAELELVELDQRIDEMDREPHVPPRQLPQQHPQQPPQLPQQLPQQLHIHHHYHVSPSEPRKPTRRKRPAIPAGLFTPPPTGRPPSCSSRASTPTPAPPIVSRLPSHRWSVFSDQRSDLTCSSLPSSPLSSNHRHSLFDRGSLADFDVPSSPATTVDPMSPSLRVANRKGVLGFSSPGLPAPRPLEATIFEEGTTPPHDIPDGPMELLNADHRRIAPSTGSPVPLLQVPRSRLRRVASHESIVSLSGGLDIHTLQTRPSQLGFRPLGTPTTVAAVATSTAVTSVTARPTISSGLGGRGGVTVLRSNLAAAPASRTPALRVSGLAKLVAWRPWGANRAVVAAVAATGPDNTDASTSDDTAPDAHIASPTASDPPTPTIVSSSPPHSDLDSGSSTAWSTTTTSTQATDLSPAPAILSASLPTPKEATGHPHNHPHHHKGRARAAGVNQPGAIPGFQEYLAAHARRLPPPKLLPDAVDRKAPREGLDV